MIFYEAVAFINRQSQDALTPDDKGTEDDSTEKGQGDTESPGNTDEADAGRVKGYVWIDSIRAVKDLTGYDFEKVFRMSALEFFAYIAYLNFDTLRKQRQIKKSMKKK